MESIKPADIVKMDHKTEAPLYPSMFNIGISVALTVPAKTMRNIVNEVKIE